MNGECKLTTQFRKPSEWYKLTHLFYPPHLHPLTPHLFILVLLLISIESTGETRCSRVFLFLPLPHQFPFSPPHPVIRIHSVFILPRITWITLVLLVSQRRRVKAAHKWEEHLGYDLLSNQKWEEVSEWAREGERERLPSKRMHFPCTYWWGSRNTRDHSVSIGIYHGLQDWKVEFGWRRSGREAFRQWTGRRESG